MASPFDALGAAAAILQFVEFGVKLSVRAVHIYTSGKGQTKEAQDVAGEMQTFQRMSKSLVAKYDPVSGTPVSADEKDIADTAKKCNDIASELLHELDELAVKGPKNVLKSLFGAVKIEIRQPRIEALQKQLDSQRTLLRDQILHLVSDQTTFMAREVRKLDQISNNLANYQQQVVRALSQQDDRRLEQQIRKLQEEGENVLFRRGVLASLKYKELGMRSGQIRKANSGTYGWIFRSAQTKSGAHLRFADWIENDNGIYWITGKAGSGKSTLMKHVYNDNRTQTGLERWANGRLLITSSHYFWYTGFKMQRAYQGLLQSILYEALRAAPELIDSVCAKRRRADLSGRDSRAAMWDLYELRECIEKLADPSLTLAGRALCFCFFIDGLDEYEGDDDQVVEMLHRFAQSPHTKVCAASRPWPKFKLSFAESIAQGNSLTLHEHTRNDIRKVVDQGLDGHAAVQRDRKTLELLKNEIVEKAQGVFLWVTLVIGQLVRGLEYADDADTLRTRLRQIPSELKDYFGVIFDRIDPTYKRQTPRLFLTCMRGDEPLPVEMFDIIISEDPGAQKLAQNTPVSKTAALASEEEVSIYRAKVSGRCQDLLEVEQTTTPETNFGRQPMSLYTIQFLHRSVQDFFGSPEMVEKLSQNAGENFDPLLTLVAAYIFLLKKTGRALQLKSSITFEWALAALRHAGAMTDIDHSLLLIQELDRTMSSVVQSRHHWTNSYPRNEDPKAMSAVSSYEEMNGRDMIGQLVILGLYEHAAELLTRRPSVVKQKSGRPYLDYALRGHINFRFGSAPTENRSLVKTLLGLGSSPNEVIYMYDDRTVWEMYLVYLYDQKAQTSTPEEIKETVWLLIDHGAKDFTVEIPTKIEGGTSSKYRNRVVRNEAKTTTMEELLDAIFEPSEAVAMTEAVKRNSVRGWGRYLKGMIGL